MYRSNTGDITRVRMPRLAKRGRRCWHERSQWRPGCAFARDPYPGRDRPGTCRAPRRPERSARDTVRYSREGLEKQPPGPTNQERMVPEEFRRPLLPLLVVDSACETSRRECGLGQERQLA